MRVISPRGAGLDRDRYCQLEGRYPTWIDFSALNFSALTALPLARRTAVTMAVYAAATSLNVSMQSIIDSLAIGRGLASLLPNDGCLLASSGGAVTVQGDPVGAIRSWTGVELANQSNVSLRAVSAATGVYVNGSKVMNLGDLSPWTQASAFTVSQLDGTTASTSGYWKIGSLAQGEFVPFLGSASLDGKVLSLFGNTTNRPNSNLVITPPNKKIVASFARSSSNLSVLIDNQTFIDSNDASVGFSPSATIFQSVNASYVGTWSALALNSTPYTAPQRAAVREFCRNYYGVVY